MASSATSEVPAHRACATCRSQKVRCILDDSNPDVCQRCARTGRPCVFTAIQKRKQRKRTDTRVAELEREMRAMRAILKQKEDEVRANSPARVTESRAERDTRHCEHNTQSQPAFQEIASAVGHVQSQDDTGLRLAQQPGPSIWPTNYDNDPLRDTHDVIDSGLISLATARQLFETYKNDLFPHYPLVYINESVEEVRQTKPALFLASIAAAAAKENADLSATLDREVLQAYATRSLIQSEKSLELVQALLISAVWYHPPSKFGQLKYYEYIHMAATMAMDLGIGSRPSVHRSPHRGQDRPDPAIHPIEDMNNPDLSMAPRFRDEEPNTANVESRRTFLSCYVICAGVSLSLRRPNMLRVSSYIKECVEYIDRAPGALPSDSTLLAWVRLLMIAEEISVAFCYDDPGAIASITDTRNQLMLKEFERKLSSWHSNVTEGQAGTDSLLIMYYTVRLYLFEIVLHVDHSAEDFRAPYQMGGMRFSPNADQVPTQVIAEATAECIDSSHALLDVFLGMTPDSLRALPVFSYVRISFAAFILAKLCLSATHPHSRIGQLLDRGTLKIESYMDRSILHIRNVVGPKNCRVPAIFLALLFKLRQWCLNPEVVRQFGSRFPALSACGKNPSTHLIEDEADREEHVIELDGPRVTEHFSSSSGSTPQTMSSDPTRTTGVPSGHSPSGLHPSNLGGTASNEEPQANVLPSQTPWIGASAPSTYPPDSSDPDEALTNNTYIPTQQAYAPMDGQVIMDDAMFQYLGDIDAFSGGGLTGLDDWASMPMDPMGTMHWQMPAEHAED